MLNRNSQLDMIYDIDALCTHRASAARDSFCYRHLCVKETCLHFYHFHIQLGAPSTRGNFGQSGGVEPGTEGF